MINTFKPFNGYTDEHWTKIREQVLHDLGVDVDQMMITTRQFSTGKSIREPLRHHIEFNVSKYPLLNAINSQKPRRRVELDAIRKDVENLRVSIIDAFTVQVGTSDNHGSWPRPGVDDDMLDATDDYFRKLESNLDRQIKQARSRNDNARKTERNELWSYLLAIWIDIGGKPKGRAAARFLTAATVPVDPNVDIKAVEAWLKRQSKTTKKVKAVNRRHAA